MARFLPFDVYGSIGFEARRYNNSGSKQNLRHSNFGKPHNV